MKRFLIVFFIIFGKCSFAQIQNDDKLFIGKSGISYIIKSSIKKEMCKICIPQQSHIKAWVILKKVKNSPGMASSNYSGKYLYCVRCKEQTFWIKYEYLYLNGKLLSEDDNPYGVFKDVVPASAEETIFNAICKYAKGKGL